MGPDRQIQKKLTFTANYATMQLLKLTVIPSLFFAFAMTFTSCEKEAEKKKVNEYKKSGIVMSGAQETPANPSTAIGSMDVSYTKATKVLTWKVTWSGLTDSLSLMHIHGLAPVGYAAGTVQNIVVPSGGIFPQKTNGKFTFLQSGTISGSLLIDGVKVKEEDLLNGLYYMNIHDNGVNPSGGTYAGGEIRGQIIFQ